MPEWATQSLFHYSHEDKHTRSGQERFTEMLGPTVIDEHTRWPLSMSWVAMMIKKLSLKASKNIKTNKQKANSVFKLPCEDVSVWGIVLIPIPRNSFPRSLFANGGSSNCLLQRAHTQKNESLHLNDWCQYSRSTNILSKLMTKITACCGSFSECCMSESSCESQGKTAPATCHKQFKSKWFCKSDTFSDKTRDLPSVMFFSIEASEPIQAHPEAG